LKIAVKIPSIALALRDLLNNSDEPECSQIESASEKEDSYASSHNND
jgi:hypothetical protein